MSNSLTVHILLRKYASNLYSLLNLALHKIFLDALNRNTFRTKYLFCCIAHADWFTIIILFISFTLLISVSVFSPKFFNHLLRKIKKKNQKVCKCILAFTPSLPFRYLFCNISTCYRFIKNKIKSNKLACSVFSLTRNMQILTYVNSVGFQLFS